MVVLAQESGAGISSLIFLAVMVGIFYLLIIRPQRKRARAQQELAESLRIGDEVRTIGGIHGVVTSLDDTSAVLRVEDGQIRISRRAIGTRIGDEA
ncbi:MAG: preprotein translocase subunit YajC [Actinobacteria bacterium]|nr:preprotein translocase subunit YajC [Actinomycetota bacterium]